MLRKILIGLTVGLTATAAAAQSTTADSVKIMTPDQMMHLIQPGHHGGFMVRNDQYASEFVDRTDSGNEVEVHAHLTHFIEVVSGNAELVYGGKVKDGKEISPGEIRGPSIEGGKTVMVHPGDYIQIPAGVPHLFNAEHGGRLHYFVVSIHS